MEMRGLMGGFYKISEWIMRLSVTNLLWIICSIPFIFLIFPVILAQSSDAIMSSLILSSIIAPFTLFPATAALFSVARKWVMGEVDAPLLRTFFRNYKECYVQSMIGGILYVALFAILIVDFRVYLVKLESLQLISYLFIAFNGAAGRFSLQLLLHGRTLPNEDVPIAEECSAAYNRPPFPLAIDGNYVWICCLH